MKVLESDEKLQKNIFIDKLTLDKNINQSINKSEICDFNLEYQKYKVPPDNHAKLREELLKLIKFVKESNLYRDINGKKITRKGKSLLTPFQRIRKLNDEIKAYYENKCNKKSSSQLIIKNYTNKDKNQYTHFNNNNENKKISLMKKYNIMKLKKWKMNEFKENHCVTMNKLNLEINSEKELDTFIKKKFRAETTNFRKNFLCISNISNIYKNKFFDVDKYNQINFWKTKILNSNSKHKKNNYDKDSSKISKNNGYFTSRNYIDKSDKNKNNEKANLLRKTINIKKISRNNAFSESKTTDDNLEKYKYKLIQFNLNKLIKPSLKYKDKIVINTKNDFAKIKKIVNNDNKKEENLIENKTKKNKIIYVNMTHNSNDLKY